MAGIEKITSKKVLINIKDEKTGKVTG